MRIAVLGPVHPYRGGIAHYTARLCQELSAQGHEVLVVNLTRQYPSALFPGSTQEDSSKQTFDVPSERLVDSMNPLSWRKAAKRIAEFGAQTLIVQWWHPYFAAAFGAVAYQARARGTQVVFVCHNVLPHESSPVDKVLAGAAYRSAHRFVVHADTEEERLGELLRDPFVSVHPHPVYDLFETDEPIDRNVARRDLELDSDRVILFFGLIRKYKGLDLLLEAMPRIIAETGAHLWIAGECYDELSDYQNQIVRLGIAPHVTLDARYVANEEVPTIMAASDVVVLPYRHATQSGIAQVAYACGRPVITTAVGGLPDVVWDEETGLLVPPEDPDAIADAVARFYSDNLAAPLEAGVKRRVAQLSWAGLVDAVLG